MAQRIPMERIVQKLDEYMARKDFAAAERHLDYWLAEAESDGDRAGMLGVANEQIGFYRKLGRGPEAMQAAERALEMAGRFGYAGETVMGTTLVNAATAYKAFGQAAHALPLYRQAQEIYEARLRRDDGRLGGLYNNMGLALADLGSYREAKELFRQAMSVMEQVPGSALERAVTCCNLADLAVAEQGREAAAETVAALLCQALELLDDAEAPRNGYYAFVCEKCAPCFADYGYPDCRDELLERAGEIYARL